MSHFIEDLKKHIEEQIKNISPIMVKKLDIRVHISLY